MKITLIFNPSVGDDGQPTLSQIEALMAEAGYRVRTQSVKETGWAQSLKLKTDFVAVAGGDGTVGKVARRLINTGIPIAILPLGTANNISRTLGIADMPITQLIPSWKSAYRHKFDAGIATGPWGTRKFIEGFGAGLLSSGMLKADNSKTLTQLPDSIVRVTYAQQLFREHLSNCREVKIEAALDGKDISGSYLLFEVMNMQYIGPNLFLAPQGEGNSGMFEIALVSEKHREKLHDKIKHWQSGLLRPPEIVALRGKHLEMNWTGYKVHFDDKVWPALGKAKPKAPAAVVVDVLSEAIEFMVPGEVHQMQQTLKEQAG